MTLALWVTGLLLGIARCASDTPTREERSAAVKLTHVLLVRQMAQSQVALSWDTCRALLCTTDKAAVTLLASQ